MVQSSVSGVASHAVYMITTSALPNLMPLGTQPLHIDGSENTQFTMGSSVYRLANVPRSEIQSLPWPGSSPSSVSAKNN